MGARKSICEEIKKLLREGAGTSSSLIPLLQAIQRRRGYLPPEALEEVARHLKVPLSRVYGVATFYAQFSLKPKGKHLVRVCLGTACHVRGAPRVLEEIKRRFEVGENGLSRDGAVSVEEVRCVGACALGPVVVVNGEYWGRMTSAKVRDLVRSLREKGDAEA
ncbi:NADH-quinone oxidoreductase subunit NuoE family protein [Candidatus Bipolaricaulota sp. J31]